MLDPPLNTTVVKNKEISLEEEKKTGRKQGSMFFTNKVGESIWCHAKIMNKVDHGSIESICTTKASSLTYMLYLNITKVLRLAPIKNVNKYLNCVFAVNAKLLNSDDKYYNVTFQLKPFVKCRASAGDCILNAAKEEENFSSVKSLKFQDLWLLKCHDGNVEIWYHRTISRICI